MVISYEKNSQVPMPKRYPPLNALKAFEAAARHASFTLAAAELGVTHGAVSKQIRQLEEFLGLKLFVRSGSGLALTDAALGYQQAIQQALGGIEEATDRLLSSNRPDDMLHIDLLPSLSSRWLIPQLGDFKKRYPHIGVQLRIGDGAVDFKRNPADLAIRVSRDASQWSHCRVTPLMGERLVPVCLPRLREQSAAFNKHRLLMHTSRPDMWQEYLQAIGQGHIKPQSSLGFEHFFMLIEAALDGLGLALIPEFLIRTEISEKRLCVFNEAHYKSPYMYYALTPAGVPPSPTLRKFIVWLDKFAVK